MRTYTINELLTLVRAVKSRMADLNRLRAESSSVERRWYGKESEVTKEPKYDLVTVDRKIMELSNFLFLAEAAIKQTNAQTKVDLNIDIEKLLEPLSEMK